jgi:hypothetical protein
MRITIAEHSGSEGYAQPPVYDDSQRVPARDQPYGELRVVREDRADTNDHGVVLASQTVDQLQRTAAAYPLRVAGPGSNTTVKRHGKLEGYEGQRLFRILNDCARLHAPACIHLTTCVRAMARLIEIALSGHPAEFNPEIRNGQHALSRWRFVIPSLGTLRLVLL